MSNFKEVELSEFGEGELLARDLLNDTKVILGIKDGGGDTWLRYNDTEGRWKKISAGLITSEAKHLIGQLYRHFMDLVYGAEGEPNTDHAKSFAYFSKRRMYSAAKEVANVAKLDKPLHLQWQDIDSRPGLLNCGNCTLDLTGPTVRRLEHSPSYLLTKRSSVHFDPSASESKLWSTFLRQIFVTESGEPDKDLELWAGKLMGYIASGLANEEVVALFYGVGANGKNTFLDTISCVLGDYAQTTDPRRLVLSSASNIDVYMAALQGARLVFAGEMPSDSKWNESAMKSLTEKYMQARHMRCDPFVFEISHTACFATNHLPSTTNQTPALWRRLKLLPFYAQFSDDIKDPTLGAKLSNERSAVLNWIIAGYERYKEEGLGTCVAGERALGLYKEEQRFGTIAHFIEECCEPDKLAHTGEPSCVHRDSIYDAYKQWCDIGSHQPVSSRQFGQELRGKGFQSKREMRNGKRGQYCFGLRMQTGRNVTRTGFGNFST